MDCTFSGGGGGGGGVCQCRLNFYANRWQKVTVFLCVSHWIIRLSSLFKNATSFLNEIAKSLYGWVVESFTHYFMNYTADSPYEVIIESFT